MIPVSHHRMGVIQLEVRSLQKGVVQVEGGHCRSGCGPSRGCDHYHYRSGCGPVVEGVVTTEVGVVQVEGVVTTEVGVVQVEGGHCRSGCGPSRGCGHTEKWMWSK
jgi:hypothetical protein